MKAQTPKKNASKAKSKATVPPKNAQPKVAAAETAAPSKSSAQPLSSKKVAKAPAVALKNLELAMKESAKKAVETANKKLGSSSGSSATVIGKRPRSAPPNREAITKPKAPAAKKVAPQPDIKSKTTATPKPKKKEVVASKTEVAPKATGNKAAAAAATSKAKPKPKRPKNILRGKGLAKKKVWQRFVIDCACVAEDLILDVADLEKYLKTHIKVKNKINQLGDLVTFERSNKFSLIIHSGVHFSKRYFKYLAKRYLKKHSLRDWVRVVSTGKETFTMRYFKIQDDDEEDDTETKA
ncbi:60S ribosomal protein L22 [Drosophila rhopaloa]|uniref:Large ribosomal subunit protein eL22 n=1 Tax=Drosophila rhopaloa TaxID=1041015 RepID=A0A6P4E7G8_DRORH|nr:60S ribosomal protein L22 [Drosophila rhopaloa]XP_016971185.1 60S ribosomal protein L22 [Drosophila rhopaloa]